MMFLKCKAIPFTRSSPFVNQERVCWQMPFLNHNYSEIMKDGCCVRYDYSQYPLCQGTEGLRDIPLQTGDFCLPLIFPSYMVFPG
jgi:hypothetical protein